MRKIPLIVLVLVCCVFYAIFIIQRLFKISAKDIKNSNHQYSIILGTGYFSQDIIDSFFDGVKSGAEKYDAVVNLMKPESSADKQNMEDWLEFAHYSCADGIIIFSNKDNFIAKELFDSYGNKIPVVVAGCCNDSSVQDSYVSINRNELGKNLANILNENRSWKNISFAINRQDNPSDTERISSAILKNVNSEKKIEKIEILSSKIEDNVRKLLISSVQEKKADVIVCFSTEILNVTAQMAIDLNLTDKIKIVGFFGNEKTKEYLQKGIISAIVTIDAFEMGMASIEELFSFKTSNSAKNFRMTRTLFLKGNEK